jgi:membrane-associated phospholipid phosphatase
MPFSAILIALALCVGLSRCYLGVHYPGDVLVGWLLAVLAVAAGST